MQPALTPAVISLLYAVLASVWIVASALLLDFAAVDPAIRAGIEVAKGLGFVLLSSAFLFILMRRSRTSPVHAPAPLHAEPGLVRQAAPLLVILALTVPLIGFAVFSLHSRQVERRAFEELGIVAGFKARQIEAWLAERRGDGTTLSGSRGFIDRVEALQKGTYDPLDKERIRDRMVAMQQAFAYESVILLNARAETLLGVGTDMEMTPALQAQVRTMAGSGTVQMGRLERNASGHSHLHFVVPLMAKGVADPIGSVLMRIDTSAFLAPLIESWPTASQSGETLIARREGDTVAILSKLRYAPTSPAQARPALADPLRPAAAALRDAGPGTMTGVDYRGMPVLAAWQPVAGTDWKLVAKVDRTEALAPSFSTAFWSAGVALLAACMVAAMTLLMFRQQRVARRLSAQAQADTLLRQFYDLPFVGMAITSPENRHWLNFNDTMCTLFGYSREELGLRTWVEMTHPEDLPAELAESERVMRGQSQGYRLNKRFLRKDGGVLYARTDVKCARGPEGHVDYLVCMIQDISAQREAEARILRLNRLYLTLSRCNAAVVRSRTEEELYAEVCRAAVESGGLKMAWVGRVDPRTKLVVPVASFGANQEYLEGIRISVDPDDPNGRGPTGTAIREGTPFWCQDFANDPRTAPWHARAAQYGWGASAGLPLRMGGNPVGALTLYDGEPNTLDEETRGLLVQMASDISFGLDNFGREAAIAESEARFRSIVEQAIAGLYIVQDGKVTYANPRLAQIFGYDSPDEVIGRDMLSFFAEEERPKIAEYVRQRVEGEIPSLSYTTRGLRKDGTAFEVGAHGGAATYQGRPAIIGLMQDISEKKRAEDQAARYLAQLQTALMRTVEVATTLSEMRDPYTAGHEKRVAQIAVAIAAELGFDAQRLEGLQIAGYLHDIGKITIPSEILSKPGKLSSAEYTLIKGHAQASYDVLKNVDFPWPIANMVLQHHERIDGTGYPQGLKGDAILLEARILAVADVIEAMASHRPYRPGLGIEKALGEIERGRGTAYDPLVADTCLKLFREKRFVLPD